MIAYIIRRLLIMIPMFLVISFLIYLGLEFTPGDPVSYMLGPDALATLSEEQLNVMKEALGLNDPFIIRLNFWLFIISAPESMIPWVENSHFGKRRLYRDALQRVFPLNLRELFPKLKFWNSLPSLPLF
jgi:peptide/nickel transport system permease protein